jgi:Zn-dependent protease with chaperone function
MMASEPLLRHPAMLALGWALVQFLWQGAVVAALLATALGLLRGPTRAVSSSLDVPVGTPSAHARYLAACAALGLMAACPILTLLGASRTAFTAEAQREVGAPLDSWPSASPAEEARPPLPAPPSASLLAGLTAAWLLGVLVLSLRLLGGWVLAQRLPRRRSRPISGPLAGRVAELARRLGIRRPVRLLASEVVPVPSVVGWLRAVILVPAVALSGLPPQQLEALLAHELAHIRRHDYLVNLLQAAVETLLFYHPAVWWASQHIRIERENCCDDLALAALGDWQAGEEPRAPAGPPPGERDFGAERQRRGPGPGRGPTDRLARLTYARALTALEELRGGDRRAGRGTTVVLAGNGGDLMARIRRILGMSGGRNETRPAWLAGVIVMPLLLATVAALRASAADGDKVPGRTGRAGAPSPAAGASDRGRGAYDDGARTKALLAGGAGSARAVSIAPQWAVYLKPVAVPPQIAITAAAERASRPEERFGNHRRVTVIRVTPGEETEPSRDDEDQAATLDEEDRAAASADENRDEDLDGRELGEQIRRQVREAVRLAHEQTRAAQEQAHRAVEEALRNRKQAERELQRVWPEVQRAQEEARRARKSALAELERARPELERAQEEARRAGERARTELERARPELKRSRDEARRARERSRAELDRIRPEVERAQEEARRATEMALVELQRVWPEVERAQEEARRATEKAMAELRRTLPQALKGLDRLKDLDCLKGLERLKGLEQLKELDRLKDLERLKDRPEPEERKEQDEPDND